MSVPAATSLEIIAARNLRGISWILLSVLGASVMSVAVKALGTGMDSRMIVALRAGIAMAVVLPAAVLFPRLGMFRFSRPWLHLWRGVLIALATHLGYYTLTQIPLATAAVLFFTAPIFATILSMVVHGEKVGPRRIAAVAAGFLGALIILRPSTGLHPAMIAALGSSALFSVALTMSRGLAEADGAPAAFLSSVVVTFVVSVPIAAPFYAMPADLWAWALFGCVVSGGMLRGFADIEAYRHAEAAVLAPITYLRLVLIGIGGYLFFNEVPDLATILGAIVIVCATLYIARREAVLKRNAAGR